MATLDDKWDCTRGRILLSGTQAIGRVLLAQAWRDARAGLATAGYVSGYRGSPLGNVDTMLWGIGERLDAAAIRFQPGVNEDLAATAIAGTQQLAQVPGARYDGVFAAWYGKGPGVDRSLDAFRHGNDAGADARGGVVLFYGDDHAGKSSTVAFQSEQAVSACLIPILYPAHAGEILDYGLHAVALSRHSGSWGSRSNASTRSSNRRSPPTSTCQASIPYCPRSATCRPRGCTPRSAGSGRCVPSRSSSSIGCRRSSPTSAPIASIARSSAPRARSSRSRRRARAMATSARR